MSRVGAISKFFIKEAFEEIFASKKLKPPIVALLMMVILAAFSIPFCSMIGMFYQPFKAIGQEGMIISLVTLAGSTIVFFFGINTVMNIFFFSNDIEYILPMPFKSRDIIIGKFLSVMVNMVMYSGILVLPLVTYGIVSHSGIMYYIYAIIVFLTLPILPMVLSSIICFILMKFTSISKNKDIFKTISGALSLVFIVAINFILQSSDAKVDPNNIAQTLANGNNSGMQMVTGLFINSKLAANALVNSNSLDGLKNIILLLVFTICIFAIFFVIGGKSYLKSATSLNDSYSKRENIFKSGNADKIIKENSPIRALVSRDIKVMFRTPRFFMSSIAMLFYMPAIMGMSIFSKGSLEKLREGLASSGSKYYAIFLVAIFGLSAFCSLGAAGYTAVSREGKDFIVSKYIPVDYKDQTISKIVSSLCINLISSIIITVLLIILKTNVIVTVLGIIVSVSTTTLLTLFGVFYDFKSPKLEWEDEKSMVNGNFTSLFIMIAALIVGGGLAGLSFLVKNYFIIFIIIIVLEVVGCTAFYNRIMELGDKLYNGE